MFRIDKVFENHRTELIKVEGEIKDSAAKDWAESLQSIINGSPKQSFSTLRRDSLSQSRRDTHSPAEHKYFLLNCPTAIVKSARRRLVGKRAGIQGKKIK
jgi:hypothetical protein